MNLLTAASICVSFSGESLFSWAWEQRAKTAQNKTARISDLRLRGSRGQSFPFEVMSHLPIKLSIVRQLLARESQWILILGEVKDLCNSSFNYTDPSHCSEELDEQENGATA